MLGAVGKPGAQASGLSGRGPNCADAVLAIRPQRKTCGEDDRLPYLGMFELTNSCSGAGSPCRWGVDTAEVPHTLPHTPYFVYVVKNITSYSFKIGSENAGVRVAQESAIFTGSKRDRRTSSHGDPERAIDEGIGTVAVPVPPFAGRDGCGASVRDSLDLLARDHTEPEA